MGKQQAGTNMTRLRLTYIGAFTLIATLVILTQVGIQLMIQSLAADASVINTAGRQRMLSQQIAKESNLLAAMIREESVERTTGGDQTPAEQLHAAIELWRSSHADLVVSAAPGEQYDHLADHLAALDPDLNAVSDAAKELLTIWDSGSLDADRARELALTVSFGADRYLPQMHGVVGLYEQASLGRIAQLSTIERILVGITLVVLLLEAFLVFEPAVRIIRRQQADAAKRSEDFERLANVAKHTSNAVVLTDPDRRITWINDAFISHTGYTLEEVRGRSPGEVLQLDRGQPDTVEAIETALRKSKSYQGDVQAVSNDGRSYWLDLDIQPLLNAGGTLTGFIAVMSDISDLVEAREHAESALREIQDLRSALDEHALITISNAKGQIVEANTAFQRISGYGREELLGAEVDLLDSGTHPDTFWREIREEIDAGRPWRGEIAYRSKNGDIFWVDSTIVPHLDSRGELDRYVSIRFDVTQSKQVQRQLEQANALMDQTGEIARVGGWVLGLETMQPSWSDEVYRIHELELGSTPDLNAALDHYPGEARDNVERAVNKAIAFGDEFDLEVPFVTAKGNHRWVRTIGRAEMHDGVCVRLWGAFQDVTERVEAERALAEVADRLDRAIDGSSDGLWEMNPHTSETWASDRCRIMLGYEPEEFPGMLEHGDDWIARIHPDDREPADRVCKAHLERGEPYDVKYRLRTKTGQYRWFRARGRAERDENGRPTIMAGSLSDIHDQQTAETRLDLSMRAANIGLWDWDLTNDTTYFSDTFYQMLGYEPGELPMNLDTWKSIAHPDDLEHAMRDIAEHLAGHSDLYTNDHRLRCKNGSYRWIRDIGEIVEHAEDGTPTRMLGVHVDIHDQRRTADRLELSLSAANAGTWDWDILGGVLRVNPTMNDLLGRPHNQTIVDQTSLAECFDEGDLAAVIEEIEQALASDGEASEVEFSVRHGDGSTRRLRCIGRVIERSSEGVPHRMMGQAFDITEQHRAAQELEAIQERMRIFVEHAPAAIAMFDRDMCYLAASAGWYNDYGLDGQEIIGRSHYEVFPEIPGRWKVLHERALAGATLSSDRDRFDRSDGSTTHLRWQIHPWRTAEGEIGGIIAFTECIDEQIEHEERLDDARRQAEAANRAKSDFLANMSHEIRTPMTAILGYADLLDTEEDVRRDPERTRDAIRTIRGNANHLLTIINDILDMSKIEAGRMTVEQIETDPVRIAEEAASLMRARATSKGVGLDLHYDTPMPAAIESDPTRLRQILLNLVGNAVKFTTEGRVSIHASCDQDNQTVSYRVTDTGVGMTPEQRDQIALFEAFSQADASTSRKFGGSGLGLRISNSLAQMLGGGIDVESELGAGSAFTVTVNTGDLDDTEFLESEQLAQHDAERPHHADAANAPAPTAAGALDGLRVLLAEDGPDNQRLISFHLKKAGAEVTIADNGRIALELLCGGDAEGDLLDPLPFDIVLTDIQMPEMDGYAFTNSMRTRGYTGPVLALTAHAMDGDRERCIEAGCDDYLTKPINKQALIDACIRWGMGGELADRTAA